jgi:cysteinyl-tRNA synthetase
VALKLYNTLTRKKEVFEPLDASNVRMYVCGPTVYDFAHIGNARPVIVFDVLFRLLHHLAAKGEWDGGKGQTKVTYVRNITDVDDKINARAAELGISIRTLTEKTYSQFQKDADALKSLRPTYQPRATEFIHREDGKTDMISLIQEIIDAGYGYVADGHVLFDVSKKTNYGKLARRTLKEMIAGARVEVAPYKRGPMDFVLWKPSDENTPGWESPWGRGRPGWHIECSAMSEAYLGQTFDIHGGGVDLVFPHHENEIAQSEAAHCDQSLARVWVHNGFLEVEGEKMAKSAGNFVVANELLRGWQGPQGLGNVESSGNSLALHELLRNWKGRAWSGNAIRLAMLGVHYRKPLNWTHERLADAERELFVIGSEFLSLVGKKFGDKVTSFANWLASVSSQLDQEFFEHLTDDLNTPKALSILRSKYSKIAVDLDVAESVLAALEFLGVLDRETLFLNTSPVLRGFFDPEAIQGAFLVGRKLQIGLLNNDSETIRKAKSLLAVWNVQIQFGPGQLLILDRKTEGAAAGRNRIEELVRARDAARAAKNFKEADRIRDELAAMGITLKDAKDPKTGELVTTWEIAR